MPRILFTHPRPATSSRTGGWSPARPCTRCALWEDQKAGALARAFKVFVHPEAGRIELTYESFDVRAAPGRELLVGSAEPVSRSAKALTYLAPMAAPRR
ncbi:MmyB family transcriptional regulator [Streptomyces nigra]|uniref:MmyB family transcriptional regulator n=1 Tax=Streptomyces nigra TaxID=1827580 RepID=UPI0037158425